VSGNTQNTTGTAATKEERQVLIGLATSLEGEVGRFAESQRGYLEVMPPKDLALWVELAEYVTPQRLRDKRSFLADALEGLDSLGQNPEIQEKVHETVPVLARRSPRLVQAYLQMTKSLAPLLPTEQFSEVTARGVELTRDIDLASTYFEQAPIVLARRDIPFLRDWHAEALLLLDTDWRAAKGFLNSVGRGSQWLSREDLPVLGELGARVAGTLRHAVKEMFQALPALLAGMTVEQLREWVNLGLEVATRDEDLVLYMSYGSKRSQEAVQLLCRQTSFSAFRGKIGLLLEAFLGEPATVRSMFDVLDPTTIPPDVPAFNDGRAIHIRPTLGCLGRSPLALYKLVALHSAAHSRFGSFRDERLVAALLEKRRSGDEEASRRLERFLVGLAEDHRIDNLLFHALPGLRQDAELVLRQIYAEFLPPANRRVDLTPATLRAQLVALPFGIRLLADDAHLRLITENTKALRDLSAGPEDALAVAARLLEQVEQLWLEGNGSSPRRMKDFDLAEVPYPPFHDHFPLGMQLAAGHAAEGGNSEITLGTPGSSLELPESFHPAEVMPELEITFKDTDGSEDELLLEEEPLPEDDAGHGTFKYDEWDYEADDYKKDWITVRCRRLPTGATTFAEETLEEYAGEVHLIQRQFERLRPERIRRYFRQTDGDELDMDALTDALVDRAAGAPMTDQLYIRRDKKVRDVAVLFLLDMSDSTDEKVEAGRRIIDVEKQGLVLLSNAIDRLDDRYAIMGFSSEGRHRVDVFTIKAFDEDYGDQVAGRIGGVEPREYTRLGAALRHATDHLAGEPAESRLLVLLSDGRPYDLGYGDVRYATEDVRMALSEGRRKGVKAFCITVDPKGPAYLDDLFGEYHYTVIQNVSHLPTRLPRIYRNLTV